MTHRVFYISYACSDSLLLTPLCYDDIHDDTPHDSALARCDRLVSKPLVIEKPTGYSIAYDSKEEPIKEEPLEEPNEEVQLQAIQSENEHLKSKAVDSTTFQTLQVQVTELKSENEGLKLSVEELTKARELVEITLRQRDELVIAQCEKMRLLEEQTKTFHEVKSEFDSNIVHDTQDNLEKDFILSLQTQLKETAELVV
ncbi:hypothetical protein Tco_0971514 [Tanacetum coccineum]